MSTVRASLDLNRRMEIINGDLVIRVQLWEPIEIESGTCRHWQIGPFRLWVARRGDEWHIASDRVPSETRLITARDVSYPDNRAWRRVAGGGDNVIRLLPKLPDRAVIVRPDSPFTFAPGSEAKFFVSIPIWISVMAGGQSTHELLCESTHQLSNTWFGDSMSGELCYALRTTARRAVVELRTWAHLAACPMRIHNQSSTPLDFQRLCLRVKHASIYANDRLWTSQVNVTSRGEDQNTRIDYVEGPPPLCADARLLQTAREPMRRGLIQQSFGDLRSFIRM